MVRVFYVPVGNRYEPTLDVGRIVDLDAGDFHMFEVGRTDEQEWCAEHVTAIYHKFLEELCPEPGVELYQAGQAWDDNFCRCRLRPTVLPVFERLRAPQICSGAWDFVSAKGNACVRHKDTVVSAAALRRLCEEYGAVILGNSYTSPSAHYRDELAKAGFVVASRGFPYLIEYDRERANRRLARSARDRKKSKDRAQQAERHNQSERARKLSGSLKNCELRYLIGIFCDTVVEALFDYTLSRLLTCVGSDKGVWRRLQRTERLWRSIRQIEGIPEILWPRINHELFNMVGLRDELPLIVRRVADRWPKGEPRRLLKFIEQMIRKAQRYGAVVDQGA